MTAPRRLFVTGLLLILLGATPAWADMTAFWGASPSPARTARGFAFGLTMLVVGFELEYSNVTEDLVGAGPGLRTGMVNGLLQTPTSRTQAYVTAGGGFFRETLGEVTENNFGTNIGGGVKIGLLGPLRLRLDYRVFNLRGTALTKTPQRFYAGANFSF